MQDIQQFLAKSLTEIKRLKATNQAFEQACREPSLVRPSATWVGSARSTSSGLRSRRRPSSVLSNAMAPAPRSAIRASR
jgi:hypothetical protein